MKQLIGLHGRAGVGKDTIADYLKDEYAFYKYSLASPLKKAAAILFALPEHVFQDSFHKEVSDSFWGLSPREILQRLGTEAMRQTFGEDHWLRLAELNLGDLLSARVVFPDVRFQNEAEWIINRGGEVWYVLRDGVKPVAAHSSEGGIPEELYNVYLNNSYSKEHLYRDIRWLMRVSKIPRKAPGSLD